MYGDRESVLEKTIDHYRQEGYTVTTGLRMRARLPKILQKYRCFPDMVARKGKQKHAVVIVEGGVRTPLATEVKMFLKNEPGWEATLIYAASFLKPPKSKPGDIIKAVAEARRLQNAKHGASALLLLWSCFEGAAHSLLERVRGRKIDYVIGTGAVTGLIHEGFLEQEDQQRFKKIIEKRHAAAHGGVKAALTQREFDYVAGVIESVMAEDAPVMVAAE
ncbi:MAG: hypothetical protein ACYYKD_03450 [Rhodospirillales bacterium]